MDHLDAAGPWYADIMLAPTPSLNLLPFLALLMVVLPPSPTAAVDDPLNDSAPISYDRSIRPILADRCYPCHGPDAATRKAKLRLDRRDNAVAPRSDGAVIVPGDAASSLMLERLRLDDPADRMPPPESKLEVSQAEIELLERWIEQGAPFNQHWSFVRAERTPPPQPADDQWSKGAIDRHVLAALERQGLAPSHQASRETLARRASFVLTGLAPDLDELDRFLADRAVGSWDRWIESLLETTAFGEQMAIHWLDVARYADSYGYQSDVHRQMWPWRDWVIDAYNSNLPHDQFIRWQIAGDLLDDATSEQRLATAFQRMHRQTNEGGSVEEEFRSEYVADRTQTFSTAFLGLTIQCARCHDHKFDPIEQREYYALSAFFDNIDESGLYSHFTSAVPTPAMAILDDDAVAQVAELTKQVENARTQLESVESTRREAFALWQQQSFDSTTPLGMPDVAAHFAFDEIVDGKCENSAVKDQPATVPAALSLTEGVLGKAIQLTGDDALSFGAIGEYSRNDPFSISLWIRPETEMERAVILHRSRAWTDAGSQGYQLMIEDGHLSAALIHFWPGDAIAVSSVDRIQPGQWTHVVFSYDGSSRAKGIDLYIDGELAAVTIIRDHLKSPITGGGPYFAIGERFRDRGFKQGRVDEMHLLNRSISAIEVRQLFFDVNHPEAQLTIETEPLYRWWLLAIDQPHRSALARLTSARKALSAFVDPKHKIMVMEEMTPPRVTHLLKRGDYDSPGEVVEPDVPAILPPLPEGLVRDRRLLADWLLSKENPLTARVAVNRLWQIAFGQGIVATSEDLGTQGMRPSHPELLDALAVEFIESGWDVKGMLQEILTSRTWMQSSGGREALLEIDPDNRFLARGPTVRMSAEMVRDHALQASGLLVDKIGGPSVLPYQPAGLWQEKSGHTYTASTGEGLYRRSLYTFWKRTSPPPTMMIFDAAKRDVCVTRRHRTSTPMQSLVLMNDPQFVEAARMMARRVLSPATAIQPSPISHAFRLMTGRAPTQEELATLQSLRDRLHQQFSEDPDAATRWLQVGASPLDEALDPIQWATMAAVCSTLFGLDETTRLR
ncbi:MAG: DUF1553 domain-containing protein [Planctomycetota bacterium]|nr:DUF1553 domain-containing protein [Planctomycetota bacterium]